MSDPLPAPTSAPPARLAERLAGLMATAWPVLSAHAGAALAVKRLDEGRYAWVDPALASAWGLGHGEAIGRTDGELFDAEAAAALRAAEQTALARGDWLASEHRLELAGRRLAYLVLRRAGAAEGDGGHEMFSLWIDQGPQRQQEAQLRQALAQLEELQRAHEALRREVQDQGLRDAGTGLYSRGHFDDQLRREVDLSTREHREFALVCIEIDPPGERVQALGAPALARIHEAMGRLLRGNTRAMDAACRLDERRFAVLLSGVGLATAHARMEGLRRQCATQIVVLAGEELGFTVAMGVASFPHTAHTQDELVQACHAALAEARRRGGNHVTLASIRFDPA